MRTTRFEKPPKVGTRVRINSPWGRYYNGRHGTVERVVHVGSIMVKLWGEKSSLPFGLSELERA